jgi:hypothetical protein|tara:strand:+ start:5055 stop:5270 length:216 start_codon:yes stop_codon:yes gene_type:complete
MRGQMKLTGKIRKYCEQYGIRYVQNTVTGDQFFKHLKSERQIRTGGDTASADWTALRGFIRKLRKEGLLDG